MLTLTARPPAEPRQRSLLPGCLQPRAPLSYELRDHHDRRLVPTLAGYKLRWGAQYRLRVRTQDKQARGYTVRLLASRTVVESPDPDQPDGEARTIAFETRSATLSEFPRLTSRVTVLPVQLEFDDGRDPYRFEIPIVVRASRFRWFASFLITALLSYLPHAFLQNQWTLPSAEQFALFGGAWIGVMLLLFVFDWWKFYRRALALRPHETRHERREIPDKPQEILQAG